MSTAPNTLDVLSIGETMALLVAQEPGPLVDVKTFSKRIAGAERTRKSRAASGRANLASHALEERLQSIPIISVPRQLRQVRVLRGDGLLRRTLPTTHQVSGQRTRARQVRVFRVP